MRKRAPVPSFVQGACDACGRSNVKLLSKTSRTSDGGSFLKINPVTGVAPRSRPAVLTDTGLLFNVCVNCWDKVKNSHCGCRTWVHLQLQAHVRVRHRPCIC